MFTNISLERFERIYEDLDPALWCLALASFCSFSVHILGPSQSSLVPLVNYPIYPTSWGAVGLALCISVMYEMSINCLGCKKTLGLLFGKKI